VALVNGDVVPAAQFPARLAALLAGKPRPEDKVVVVKSDDDVPYHFWMTVTSQIEDAGGIITLQIEEEREVQVP
jgi:biopolymer transport protein ExbD